MASPSNSLFYRRLNLRAIAFVGTLLFLGGWPVYTFLAETLTRGVHDRGNFKEVDLKAMGFFQMDPHDATFESVPEVYRRLDGQKVLLTGIVVPDREAGSRITNFTLQYALLSCCTFGSPPLVQEKVYATAASGHALPYLGRRRDTDRYEVFGTLRVTMKKDPETGVVVEVYHLDAESMKPVQ